MPGVDLEAEERSVIKGEKRTPMYRAMFGNRKNSIQCVEILLDAGAKIYFNQFGKRRVQIGKRLVEDKRPVIEPFNDQLFESL